MTMRFRYITPFMFFALLLAFLIGDVFKLNTAHAVIYGRSGVVEWLTVLLALLTFSMCIYYRRTGLVAPIALLVFGEETRWGLPYILPEQVYANMPIQRLDDLITMLLGEWSAIGFVLVLGVIFIIMNNWKMFKTRFLYMRRHRRSRFLWRSFVFFVVAWFVIDHFVNVDSHHYNHWEETCEMLAIWSLFSLSLQRFAREWQIRNAGADDVETAKLLGPDK